MAGVLKKKSTRGLKLDSKDTKDLQFILGSLLTALGILTEAVGNLQTMIKNRLPVWGDIDEQPKAKDKPN